MAAVANNPKFAKEVGIPTSVGKKFANADKRNKEMPSKYNSTANKPGKAVKKYNRGGVMAHDKKVLRNLSDEDYRIRNRSGSNTDAERRRIDRERSYLRNQEGSYSAGGGVGSASSRGDGIAQQGHTRGRIV